MENNDIIWIRKLSFESCGRYVILLHLIVLLTDPILSPSTDFGRPKQGQNCLAANFRPKCVCAPMYTAFSPFLAHYNIPFRFRVNARREKKSVFTIFLVRPHKTFGSLLGAQFWCHRPSTKLARTAALGRWSRWSRPKGGRGKSLELCLSAASC